jgi:hypothetical protein
VILVVCVLGSGRPASAMESTKVEIKIGDVSFLLHEVCVGADPKTGLIRVVTQMELTPAPYAQPWVAQFTAMGPDEDLSHAFAAIAGVALFFGQQKSLDRLGPSFMLDVKRLSVWQGLVSDVQVLDALHGALQLFSSAEPGVVRAFDMLRSFLGFPAEQCQPTDVIGKIE